MNEGSLKNAGPRLDAVVRSLRGAAEKMEAAGRVEDLGSSDEDEVPTLPPAGTVLLSAAGDLDAGGRAHPIRRPDGGAAATIDALHGALGDSSGDDDWDADALLGAEEPGGGIANDARWAIGRLAALPPVSLAWLLVLLGCGSACALWPSYKGTLAMHWPLVADEPWRLATAFSCLGGEFLSFQTLMSAAVIAESVASYERLLLFSRPMTFRVVPPFGQHRSEIRVSVAFLCLAISGAGFLLASQCWGVRTGLYRRFLSQSTRLSPATINAWFRTHPWLSHDLIFLLLSVSCWDQPHVPTELGFIPGLPPIARWQLPFVLSGVHLALGGSVYAEAIAASVPTHILCNVRVVS